MRIIHQTQKTTNTIHLVYSTDDFTEYYRLQLLSLVLHRRSQRFPEKHQFQQHLADLYSTSVRVFSETFGKHLTLEISVNYLKSRFVPQALDGAVLQVLQDLITNPLSATEEDLQDAKFVFAQKVLKVKANISSFSEYQALKRASSNPFLSFDYLNEQQQLEEVTLADLQACYARIIGTGYQFAYLIGEFADDFVSKLSFLQERKEALDTPRYTLEENELAKETSVSVTSVDLSQALLILVYQIKFPIHEVKSYVTLMLCDYILGGSFVSLLMQDLREKRGLCYGVRSWCMYYEQLMVVKTGVTESRLAEAYQAIMENLEFLQKGQLTIEQLNSFQQQLRAKLIFDTQEARVMIGYHQLTTNLQFPTSIEELLGVISTIEVADIQAVAQSLQLIFHYEVRNGS